MTRQEFIDKYADVLVDFYSYYKYTFTFKGLVKGKEIFVDFGGDSSEIYRFDVTANSPISVRELQPYSGKCGEDSFYDF